MQSATWEVDDLGDFRVKIDLKEERFGKGETEIRWNSRERWENQVRRLSQTRRRGPTLTRTSQDGTLRFTIAENRYSDTSRHDYSTELCSPTLNQLLANYALDQAHRVWRDVCQSRLMLCASLRSTFNATLVLTACSTVSIDDTHSMSIPLSAA